MGNLVEGLVHGLALGKVTGLYRHAVKGFSADSFHAVHLTSSSGTFPDDRRYALMKTSSAFDPTNPEWLHKDNFLCTFTDPHLMARYRASYSMDMGMDDGKPNDEAILTDGAAGKYFTLHDRISERKVLGPLDLSTEEGRQALADFFSEKAGIPLACVTADRHQFGNTSKGWKERKDTRTVHIVNESTVKALQAKIGDDNIALDPTRFRPNIVLQGNTEPFSEFEWVGKSIQCGSSVQLEVISKTVRCRGVGIDPLDPSTPAIDIPSLLKQHFPKQGPYLGVYAVDVSGGTVAIGDDVVLI